jgi:hypothetical protein
MTQKQKLRLISSSYAGACAAHYVSFYTKSMKDKSSYKKLFRYFYNYVKSTCEGITEDLPSKLSLREIIMSSPANREFGGF